jgi:hypothetical protein
VSRPKAKAARGVAVSRLVAPLPGWAVALFAAALAAIVLVRHAEPILDGDLFWHLAYARQMIERGTPIPDHTIYSWTPAVTEMIYCAWLAELTLYAVWHAFDLAGIFALRYAAVFAIVALAWLHAARLGVGRAPAALVAMLVLVVASRVGTLPKPELFSLLFLNVAVFLYAEARRSIEAGRDPRRYLYAVPLTLVAWANSHGGFILIAPFLAVVFAAEAVLVLRQAHRNIGSRFLRHMTFAWLLCVPAICLTPYGLAYPRQLLADYLTGGTPRPDTVWNVAHRSIFDPAVQSYRLVECLAVIVAGLGILAWLLARRGGGAPLAARLPLLLAALAYVPLYAAIIRTTYFLPAVAAYAALALLRDLDQPAAGHAGTARATATGLASGAARAAAPLAAVLGVGIYLVFEAAQRPWWGSWLGFGISYINPVAEAEFLARQPPAVGQRFYNIFDSGGYLLWRLHPRYKVMVDSRSFPYLSWFEDQYAFATGKRFEAFLARYPADIAVIDLAKRDLWRNFMRTSDWRLVFHGPTAAVFVRQNLMGELVLTAADRDPRRFADIRNGAAAVGVFEFTTFVGDFGAAQVVLARIETALSGQLDAAALETMRSYREGYRALLARQYDRALALFEKGLRNRLISDRDRLLVGLVQALLAIKGEAEASRRQPIEAAIAKIAQAAKPFE